MQHVIVWLNGTFGVGKTTTAQALLDARPQLRLFDPEWVGYMLRANLAGIAPDDFQDLAAWRELVPVVAARISAFSGQPRIAVQTVLHEQYWHELRAGVEAVGLELVHVLLDADVETIRRRIVGDQVERDAEQWRLDHLPTFADARPWMTQAADLVVDTTARSTGEVVSDILAISAVASLA